MELNSLLETIPNEILSHIVVIAIKNCDKIKYVKQCIVSITLTCKTFNRTVNSLFGVKKTYKSRITWFTLFLHELCDTFMFLDTSFVAHSLKMPICKFYKKLGESLEKAIKKGDTKKITRLLDKGADINHSYTTFRPLHLAASRKNPKVVDLLLKRGANPFIMTMRGTTPLENLYQEEKEDEVFRGTESRSKRVMKCECLLIEGMKNYKQDIVLIHITDTSRMIYYYNKFGKQFYSILLDDGTILTPNKYYESLEIEMNNFFLELELELEL